jgi:hypothetical protein
MQKIVLAFAFCSCENAFTRPIVGAAATHTTGSTVNTTTQQQMTNGRNAFGLSLLATVQLDLLKQSCKAVASMQQRADYTDRHDPVAPGFRGHRGQRTHHIRGGNP